MAMAVAGLHRRAGGRSAPRDGLQALREAHAATRRPAARGHGQARHHRRDRRSHRAVDYLVCVVWLSRVARRQLRADRVCERLLQDALPGGVLHGAAQQPADGVLSPGHAGQGRAAPRRALQPDRRAGVGVGLHGGSRWRGAARAALRARIARGDRQEDRVDARAFADAAPRTKCPKCGCDDRVDDRKFAGPHHLTTAGPQCFCNVCSHEWSVSAASPPQRFRSIDDLVRRVNLRRDEIAMLAEIGALNSLGHDRRSAMWQVERAIRPAGELFEGSAVEALVEQAFEPRFSRQILRWRK